MRRSVSRRAVSLLEVLVAIFVLTIGLLSVSTLIPAGQSQVMKSMIEDRKLAVAEQALVEANARGFFQTFTDTSVTPARIATRFIRVNTSGNLVTVYEDQLPVFGSFAIDPLGILSNTPSNVAAFPYDVDTSSTAPVPTMSRVTLRQGSSGISLPVARSIFFNDDDLTFEAPDDPEEPLTGGFAEDGSGNPLSRYADSRYSWLVTMCPEQAIKIIWDFSTSPPVPTEHPSAALKYSASFVVFRNRQLEMGTSEEGTPLERCVSAFFTDDSGMTGGSLTLSSPDQEDLQEVKPNDWVMVGGFHRLAIATVPLRTFKWYRVLNVDEVQGTGPFTLEINVHGEDWNGRRYPVGHANAGMLEPVSCSLFSDIVTVKNVTLNMEQASQWSQ